MYLPLIIVLTFMLYFVLIADFCTIYVNEHWLLYIKYTISELIKKCSNYWFLLLVKTAVVLLQLIEDSNKLIMITIMINPDESGHSKS